MRQLGIVPAGYHSNVSGCITDGSQYFAYCSNLAIYIFELESCRLKHIIAGYERTITSIDWNPYDSSQIVATSHDKTVTIWNITAEANLLSITMEYPPVLAMWNRIDPNLIAIVTEDNVMRIWDIGSKTTTKPIKDLNHSKVRRIRWSPRIASLLAAGHEDCSITIYRTVTDKSQKFKCKDKDLGAHTGGVLDLEWDPLSDNYLLASFGGGTMALFDVDALGMVRTFDKQAGGGIGCLEWIRGSPGSFLAASERHGSVRRWNVSQSHAEEAYKVGNSGFKTVRILPGDARVLTAGIDGSVGVYNIKLKRWDHEILSGHSETIFACEFQRTNKDVLATGSFDQTIKLWNVSTMQAIDTLKPNAGVIYSIAWPHILGDLRMACATSEGKVVIMYAFGPKKGTVAATFAETSGFVYKVAWSSEHPDILASCGQDGFVWIFSSDGGLTVKAKVAHPGPCYGCDFTVGNSSQRMPLLVTACEDKKIRVFDVENPKVPVLLHSLVGHVEKVFGVFWSPIIPGWLASASDDCSVRVWDVVNPGKHIILQGHVQKVRALAWHHEVAYLLLSGSWDGCIRVWDVRGTGLCIRVVLDHHADVYGLASHPERPFLFASSSRDMTVRFWRLDTATPVLVMSALASDDWEKDKVVGLWSECSDVTTRLMMCGQQSKKVAQEVSECQDRLSRALVLAKFLCQPDGLQEVCQLTAAQGSTVPEITSGRVIHGKSLFNVLLAEASELEKTRTSGFGGIGRQTKEQALVKAAGIYARLGYMKQYCEIMAELGDWSKALELAPVVSMAYWKSLAARRAAVLMSEDSFDCVPLLIGCGRVDAASSFLAAHGNLDDSFCVAQVHYAGGYDKIASALAAKPAPPPQPALPHNGLGPAGPCGPAGATGGPGGLPSPSPNKLAPLDPLDPLDPLEMDGGRATCPLLRLGGGEGAKTSEVAAGGGARGAESD